MRVSLMTVLLGALVLVLVQAAQAAACGPYPFGC